MCAWAGNKTAFVCMPYYPDMTFKTNSLATKRYMPPPTFLFCVRDVLAQKELNMEEQGAPRTLNQA